MISAYAVSAAESYGTDLLELSRGVTWQQNMCSDFQCNNQLGQATITVQSLTAVNPVTANIELEIITPTATFQKSASLNSTYTYLNIETGEFSGAEGRIADSEAELYFNEGSFYVHSTGMNPIIVACTSPDDNPDCAEDVVPNPTTAQPPASGDDMGDPTPELISAPGSNPTPEPIAEDQPNGAEDTNKAAVKRTASPALVKFVVAVLLIALLMLVIQIIANAKHKKKKKIPPPKPKHKEKKKK